MASDCGVWKEEIMFWLVCILIVAGCFYVLSAVALGLFMKHKTGELYEPRAAPSKSNDHKFVFKRVLKILEGRRKDA